MTRLHWHLWTSLSPHEQAIVPLLGADPEEVAVRLGAGPETAAALQAGIREKLRLATVDDDAAESVMVGLLRIAQGAQRVGWWRHVARQAPEYEERDAVNWDLSPAERELLRRDCEASKVPIAVEDPDAIKKVVGLITKARVAVVPPPESLEPPRQAEGAPAENGTPTGHSNVNSNFIKQYCNGTLGRWSPLTWALSYAAAGHLVIPLEHGRNIPHRRLLGSGWSAKAGAAGSRDPDQIKAWVAVRLQRDDRHRHGCQPFVARAGHRYRHQAREAERLGVDFRSHGGGRAAAGNHERDQPVRRDASPLRDAGGRALGAVQARLAARRRHPLDGARAAVCEVDHAKGAAQSDGGLCLLPVGIHQASCQLSLMRGFR
jgi:DNA-binding CsgD family transcriptional regulator